MHEETVGSKIVKWVLIGVSVLFLKFRMTH